MVIGRGNEPATGSGYSHLNLNGTKKNKKWSIFIREGVHREEMGKDQKERSPRTNLPVHTTSLSRFL